MLKGFNIRCGGWLYAPPTRERTEDQADCCRDDMPLERDRRILAFWQIEQAGTAGQKYGYAKDQRGARDCTGHKPGSKDADDRQYARSAFADQNRVGVNDNSGPGESKGEDQRGRLAKVQRRLTRGTFGLSRGFLLRSPSTTRSFMLRPPFGYFSV